jgi:uncharacterized repeat protein (TIGR01451 family)
MSQKIRGILAGGGIFLLLAITGGLFLVLPKNAQAATAGPVGHDVEFTVISPLLNTSTLDANPRRVGVGSEVTYTMVVRNTGSAQATGTRAICPVPDYTTYVAGSITGVGNDDSDPDLLEWNIGNLAIGGTATLTFRVLVSLNTPDETVLSTQGRIFCNELYPTLTSDPTKATDFQPTTVTVYRTAVPGGVVVPPEAGASILQAMIILFLTALAVRQIYRHRQRVKSQPAVILN